MDHALTKTVTQKIRHVHGVFAGSAKGSKPDVAGDEITRLTLIRRRRGDETLTKLNLIRRRRDDESLTHPRINERWWVGLVFSPSPPQKEEEGRGEEAFLFSS